MSPRKTTERPTDPNDPVEQMIDRVREAYRRVQHFPEDAGDGWIKLIELRNLVPELVRELRRLNEETKKPPPALG